MLDEYFNCKNVVLYNLRSHLSQYSIFVKKTKQIMKLKKIYSCQYSFFFKKKQRNVKKKIMRSPLCYTSHLEKHHVLNNEKK